MKEKWKPIKGYEKEYLVSSFGKVLSLERIVIGYEGNPHLVNEKILRQHSNGDGYPHVTLYKKGKRKTIAVHRLVARNFLKNPLNKSQINHMDGNKINNRLSNLEWVTPSENCIHAERTHLRPNGESHCYSKLTWKQVLEIRKIYGKNGNTLRKLAKIYGINHSSIRAIVTNKTWLNP